MGQITDNELAQRYSSEYCLGIVAALRQALKDEHDAVNTYLDIGDKFDRYGTVEISMMMRHLAREERYHEIEIEELIRQLELECNVTTNINDSTLKQIKLEARTMMKKAEELRYR